MDSRKLAQRCRALAEDKKAENVIVLDVRKLSGVTDYFVIATGTSEPHLRAVVDEIVDRLREEAALRPNARDGALQTSWVVLDYFDVIVHVMRAEVRERYDLEGLWGDAPKVPKPARRRAASADGKAAPRKRAATAKSPPRKRPAAKRKPKAEPEAG